MPPHRDVWLHTTTPPPQSKDTLFHPRSRYATTKVATQCYTVNYREAYHIFGQQRALQPRVHAMARTHAQDHDMTRAIGRIKVGLQTKVFVGSQRLGIRWGLR